MMSSDRAAQLILANLGTKVISVVIAFVLWGVVLGSRNVEVTKEVALEVVTSADVVPSNEVPEKVSFRLSGPKAFLRAIIDRRDDPIVVNLVGAKPGAVTYRFFSDNIRLPIGVKVQSINPNAILVKLEAVKKKEIPLRVETRGVLAEGFQIAKIEVNPPFVRVKGAESRIESFAEVHSMPIDVSGLKSTIEREVVVDINKWNLALDGASPKVKITVEPITSNFRIKNVDIRVMANGVVNFEPKVLQVHVRMAKSDGKSIDRSQVYALIDVRDKTKGSYQMVPKIIVPPDMTVIKTIPESLKVELK